MRLPVTDEPVDAGEFSAWLAETLDSMHRGQGVDVPCGDCVACCTSSLFVHIEADEAEARAHIPAAWMFDAPGAPPGTKVVGHNEQGHCPLMVESACTIYAHRPRTCREYDCRVFAAAGLRPESQPKIDARVVRWRFSYVDQAAREAHEAVKATARFLCDHPAAFSRPPPPSRLGIALAALRGHPALLGNADDARPVADIARDIEAWAR